MASKKGSKEVVKLENKETGYFYTTKHRIRQGRSPQATHE